MFTYCSSYSPHDRHYFQQQAELVAGAVQAPRLDLCNRELLLTHLNALAVSEIGMPGLEEQDGAKPSIMRLVVDDHDQMPVAPEVRSGLHILPGTFDALTSSRTLHPNWKPRPQAGIPINGWSKICPSWRIISIPLSIAGGICIVRRGQSSRQPRGTSRAARSVWVAMHTASTSAIRIRPRANWTCCGTISAACPQSFPSSIPIAIWRRKGFSGLQLYAFATAHLSAYRRFFRRVHLASACHSLARVWPTQHHLSQRA